MSRELFSHDPMTGMTVWFDYNELTDETTLEYEQDVEPILELNKQLANDPDVTKEGFKQEMWKYASIPNGIAMKWLLEEGLDIYDDNAWPQIWAKLNDPQYKYLKATDKYHGKKARLIV
jgi:hypothetical protein